MDVFDRKTRSQIMSKIRNKDTTPELLVRSALKEINIKFSRNDKRIIGRPDFKITGEKTVIFVNGCFWHHHNKCKKAKLPESNIEFWKNKINKNIERDKKNLNVLEENGYKVITLWECQIKKEKNNLTKYLKKKI